VTSATGDPTPSARRSIGVVGLALLIATMLGALLPIVCARLMPAADYRYFLAFWGLLFGFGSALSPVEQDVSRQASEAVIAGRRVDASVVRAVASAGAAIAVVGGIVCVPMVSDRLFGPHPLLAVIAASGGLAFAVQYGVRGVLIGEQRVVGYGGIVVAEALVRAVGILVVVLVGTTSVYALAFVVGLGSLGWIVFVRSVSKSISFTSAYESWRESSRRILILMVSAAFTASVITGYPAVVNLLVPADDDVAIAGLFAALTVARFPLVLLSPIQALTVPTVVHLSSSREGRGRLRRFLVGGIAATGLIAAAAAAVCGWLGPLVVGIVFGDRYVVSRATVGGLGWSSIVLAAVLILAAVLVARAQVIRVLIIWAVVAVTCAVVLLVWPGGAVAKATAGLVIGPTVGMILAGVLVLRVPVEDGAADSVV
jgi:O-antigen/teichoic acid export membrane protein